MKKQNNMKKMLVFTMFSMLASISMFVGTTYAWFTDEISISKNQIVAGNLDVELYSKVNGEYTPVTEETTLFDQNALWEPGHVEVVNLKVANVGTLALEYSLGINILPNEVASISVATNEAFKLSDFIKYAVIEGEETYNTRDEAIVAAERYTPRKLSEINYEEGYELLPKDEAHPENVSEHCVTMIVYMPKEVTNEANHKKGAPTPKIELGVNLSARQTSFESDGFDDKYDESVSEYGAKINNKFYKTVSAALATAKDGETVKLLKDTSVKTIAYKPVTPTAVTLDLNGHTLSTTSAYTNYLGDYKTGMDLDFTIKNGTINTLGSALQPDGGTKLTLDNVEVNASSNYGVTMPSLGSNNPTGKAIELVVKNSIITSNYAGVSNFGPYSVTIENSTIQGKWFGLTHNGQAKAAPATYNITGSTISATGTEPGTIGVYISNSPTTEDKVHTFNLTNSTITGGTALEVKHTNATIQRCTLVATADALMTMENGGGSCTQGYSLAVTTNSATSPISGTVSIDETSTLTWKKGEVEEEGKVFVFNPDGATTNVTVKGVTVADVMTYNDHPAA